MKVLLTLIMVGMAGSVLAYAELNFANRGWGVNAPIYVGYVGSSQLPVGDDYRVQLFWGPLGAVERDLEDVGPAVAFSTLDGQAGYFFGGVRRHDAWGSVGFEWITVQVRAWKTSTGLSWAAAATNPLGQVGRSELFSARPTFPGGAPPMNLVGLKSFAIVPVPEPSSFAVLGLGAAATLLSRRQQGCF